MAIVTGDISLQLSGGTSNTLPASSLGGAISSTAITNASLHNLFDIVSSGEASSGDTEYRCFYIKNNHATLTWQSVLVWIQTQTPSATTSWEFALGTSAVNGTEQSVANESTAPTGVSWSTVSTEGTALSIGNIPNGQHKAIWCKRIVSAGAGSYNTDSALMMFKGDTAA